MCLQKNIQILKNKYDNKAPIAVGFNTADNYYIYDAGTGKVIQCKEIEYKIVIKIICNKIDEIDKLGDIYGAKEVDKAIQSIIKCIQKEHILEVEKFKSILVAPNYKEKIQKGQQQLTLELTEKCNLRCRYCIYHEEFDGDRDFGESKMTEEIAFKAIDYFYNHCLDEEEVSVTFYGGEPLLEFNLMKKCMEYSSKIFGQRKQIVSFGFTTNLVLITPEIAKFLSQQEKINIIGSLDGPQEIHDYYRVDIKGSGTFTRAMRGLRYLVEEFGERAKDCISINMVYTPPYSESKLQEIGEFFEHTTWLPKELRKSMSYVEGGTLPKEIEEVIQEEYETNTLMDRARDKVGSQDFTKDMIDRALLRIYHSPIFNEPVDVITMNGCCLPGQRRLYVTVDGQFKMCERVGKAPLIGNVDEGVDVDIIKKEFIDNYTNKSLEDCSTCWAARLCSVCYSNCYRKGEFSLEEKRIECENTKYLMWQDLAYYYETLEKNPERLKYLEEIEVG